jgi:hypothetical protein
VNCFSLPATDHTDVVPFDGNVIYIYERVNYLFCLYKLHYLQKFRRHIVNSIGDKPLECFAAIEFFGQTAASGCVFPTFRQLIPSTSSGCANGLVASKLMTSVLVLSK